MVMFFVSLMAITNVGKLFYSLSYSIGNVFNKNRRSELSFYDYSLEKDKKRKKSSASSLIIGLIYIFVSVYIALYMM